MSAGYADMLSPRADLGGRLGDPEVHDPAEEVEAKCRELARLIGDAAPGKVVAFTGAGVSTACGLPDFRGPTGIWTLRAKQQTAADDRAEEDCVDGSCDEERSTKKPVHLKTSAQSDHSSGGGVSFAHAKPSLTHMALSTLYDTGKLGFCISQNVDNLHLRSGLPLAALAELHGNCFSERCFKCGLKVLRDFGMRSVGFQPTGRRCPSCGGRLRDNILDWEDALPADELKQRLGERANEAEVMLCLGTSMRITPACNLPLRTVRRGGKMVIVNLQPTPKDKQAAVVIHAPVDTVMARVMQHLQLPIRDFVRRDRVYVALLRAGGRAAAQGVRVRAVVQSPHGAKCALPMVASTVVELRVAGGRTTTRTGPAPLAAARTVPAGAKVTLAVTLTLHEQADADCRSQRAELEVEVAESAGGAGEVLAEKTLEFVTQRVSYQPSTKQPAGPEDHKRGAGAASSSAKRARRKK